MRRWRRNLNAVKAILIYNIDEQTFSIKIFIKALIIYKIGIMI